MRQCPVQAICIKEKKARISAACVQCGVCVRVCPEKAISRSAQAPGTIKCTNCPVQCEIHPETTGACLRYKNENGVLCRNRPLELEPSPAAREYAASFAQSFSHRSPLITAVGAGSTYPCCRPAPHIVSDTVDGVDVVTVVTEAPLSYSGLKVKIDTNFHIGEEGAKVLRNNRVVGMVDTEEYGSKMLSIGGANLLTGETGFDVARTIVALANGEEVKLKVENGARLALKLGEKPVINGVRDDKMRVGCGSATVGLFARLFKDAVDQGHFQEVIILDHHVVGLFSEHLAGEEVGMRFSGVLPNARKSTRGRYFGEHGTGWGGTGISNAVEAVASVDLALCPPGSRILVTETTGRMAALLEVLPKGSETLVREVPMTEAVRAVVKAIENTCEDACVSVIYTGGSGGSARGGVTTNPIGLTRAMHEGKVSMTVAGAPAFILPGGGINFMVDVAKAVPRAFTWVPTPATVAPVEYTMRLEDYRAIGGHMASIKPVAELKKRK
ncbi:4Fe-4S binding protein [Desulfovibrio aminophilus]|uniref:indolepyruvate ferredoxin oxidoreductase subunit alpha n=1 Tax=Desulfovibrio aminophilus TaxID=81425 RepID=UPI0033913BC6